MLLPKATVHPSPRTDPKGTTEDHQSRGHTTSPRRATSPVRKRSPRNDRRHSPSKRSLTYLIDYFYLLVAKTHGWC